MTHRDILRLALEADISPNTARKALKLGPASIRGRAGEKAAEAMARLGLANESAKEPKAA